MIKDIDTLLLGWPRVPPAKGSIGLACRTPSLVCARGVWPRGSNENIVVTVWHERPEAAAYVRLNFRACF